MNEFLAEMYNTRESIGAEGSAGDIEKMAEAQILSDELAAEGYDASQLPPETLMKVAYELWGEDSALVKAAQEDMEEEEGEKEEEGEGEEEGEKKEGSFEEKVAEADFLGRVMAHSFVNEQSSMEKEALSGAQALQAMKNWGQLAGYGAKRGAGAVAERAGGAAKKLREAASAKAGKMQHSYGMGRDFTVKPGRKAGSTITTERGKKSVIGGLSRLAKEHPGATAGLAAAGTAAATGAAYGGYKGVQALKDKKKAASALDALAEQRAMEMLKEAGYEVESEEDRLKEAVDQRALEMLAEAGYLEE
jgi:hypothetical protein